MGSSGQKRRKKTKHPQHLTKVGHESTQQKMHEDHQGMMDTMGVGGLSPATRNIIIGVVALLFIGGIIGLLILNTF
jgi:hypothetical protein